MKDTATGMQQRGQALQNSTDYGPVPPKNAAIAPCERSAVPNAIPGTDEHVGGSRPATQVTAAGRLQSVSQTVEIMNMIVERIATSGMVSHLGKSSDRIGALTGAIEEISDQASMLAISQAIETTRSAVPGPGFDQVAEQVRALAEQADQATRKIGEAIRAMRGIGTTPTTADGAGPPQNGCKFEAQPGSTLQQVLGQIVTLSRQVSLIATTTCDQVTIASPPPSVTGERPAAKDDQPPATRETEIATGSKELDILIARVKRN